MTYEIAIASAWPGVAAIGRAEARRLGLPKDVVEDLVQDAAAVVMRRRPEFSTSEDLAPYVRIVVRRLAYRWLRNQAREVVGPVPDRPVSHSVAELAEYRLKLRGTVEAFSGLSPTEKGRLTSYLAAEGRTGDTRQRARERKQIERIRVAMNRVAEGFAAALGWVRMRLRWAEVVPPEAAAAMLALTGIVALVMPPLSTPTEGSVAEVQLVGTEPVAAVSLPDPNVQAAGGGDHTHEASRGGPSARRSTTRDPGPASTTTEVVHITTPTGNDAGWKRTTHPTEQPLLCVDAKETGHTCVDQVELPPSPL